MHQKSSAPTAVAAKLGHAVTLHRRGELAEAQALYEEILRAQPRHYDALHLLGVIAWSSGNPGKAAQLIGQAIEIDPHDHNAYNNRGLALQDAGEREAALASFDRALALKADCAESYYNRANVLKDLQRWQAALTDYDRAIALKDSYAEAYSNRGIVLCELKRAAAALPSYDRAITLKGDLVHAHYNRANLLCELRRWDEALAGYDRAIALKSDHAEAYSGRSVALHELARTEDALDSCNRALAIKPDLADAYCNKGTLLLAVGRVDEALASYDQAVALAPARASSRVNRALTLLLSGHYERGWTEYHWRWQDTSSWIMCDKREFSQPLWLGGAPLTGKTILLHSEQGYGDTIQFCRYAKLVAERGARVILEVPRALAALLSSLEGVAQLIIQGEPLPSFDYYCPLLSLPLAVKTTLADVPARVPYLAVDAARRRHWSEKLGERARPRVGLVWSGGLRPLRPELWSINSRRNVPLAAFTALQHCDVDFYSLQKGSPAESELAELTARNWGGPLIRDLGPEIQDFADTAAVIEQLDLVISVDTATAHLAGALGKPVWILNRFDTCWRWLLDRTDSPWYPTARLYRQARPGDWEGVLRRVCDDLFDGQRLGAG